MSEGLPSSAIEAATGLLSAYVERAAAAGLRQLPEDRAMEVVRATDCIFPGPPFFIQQRDLSEALITIPIPGGEELMMKFVIVYHERVADSPAHQFLLAQIVAAVNHYRVNAGLPELDELRRARKLAD